MTKVKNMGLMVFVIYRYRENKQNYRCQVDSKKFGNSISQKELDDYINPLVEKYPLKKLIWQIDMVDLDSMTAKSS